MARTSIKVKCQRKKDEARHRHSIGKDIKFPTRVYNRCKQCGKVRGYMRDFELCRICVRELARDGKIMGLKKSSW